MPDAEILAHPSRLTGAVAVNGHQALTLPPPPATPSFDLERLPDVVAELGSDATVTLLQVLARCEFDPGQGWCTTGSKHTVAQWNGWGLDRSRAALQALLSANLLRRHQARELTSHGGVRLGRGVLVLTPNAAVASAPLPGTSPDTHAPVNLVAGPAAVEISASEQCGVGTEAPSWGPPLPENVLTQVLEQMEFSGAAQAVKLYGPQLVSDAVRLSLYRVLSGRVRNAGGYVRKVLLRGEVAAPPPSLASGYLLHPHDVFEAVSFTGSTDLLAKARSKLISRKAAAHAVWLSLPDDVKLPLDEELTRCMSAFTLEPHERKAWIEVELMEQLLAEQGLLAQLPEAGT